VITVDMIKARAIQHLAQGRSNATGSFALTANATTTTVPAINCGPESVVLLSPLTAHASAEIGNGTIYCAPGVSEFTVTHANNSQTDRTFGFVCLG